MSSKEISNTTLLFIRACKTQTPVRNIMRVYRRYYYRDTVRVPYQHISTILRGIVDTHITHDCCSLDSSVESSRRVAIWYDE